MSENKSVWVLEYRRADEPACEWHFCGLAESEMAAKLSFHGWGHSNHWYTLKRKYYQYMRGNVVTYRIHPMGLMRESDFAEQSEIEALRKVLAAESGDA